jgi:nicotinamide-nucleotide amidase
MMGKRWNWEEWVGKWKKFMDRAKKLGEILKKRGLLLVTAESCTGGMLAEIITSIPGSSAWFERGLITYSNLAKQELLGVTLATIEKYGAVSTQVAKEMANGALAASHAQISIAITGIAGPNGGTIDKPIGTACFACAKKNCQTKTFLQQFFGNRTSIRKQAVQFALEQLIIVV